MNKKSKIIIAMSGGVDSSVAAALLKKGLVYPELGRREVIGVFMKLWKPDGKRSENRCCSLESEKRARKVAKILGIPFYILNFEKEFKKRVVDYFLKELRAGRTPNPCVVCNREIKFGLLLEKALKMGADYVATGHYARKIQNPKSKIQKLLCGRDKEKDQSYFLWQLNQKQLSRILFPVGNYTRKEVEGLAKKFKLPFSGVKKSFEVCFVPKTLEDFLKIYLKPNPGDIVNKKGEKLGRHRGLWFYTIGQRKGIGFPGGPYFVLDKNPKKNQIIITKNEKDLYKKDLIAKNINWIHPVKCRETAISPKAKLFNRVKAKIRYRAKEAPAKIYILDKNRVKVVFEKPQRAITPGQSVVFYKGEKLIGGGIIDRIK